MPRGKTMCLYKKEKKKRHIALGAECRSSAEKYLTHKTSLHTLKQLQTLNNKDSFLQKATVGGPAAWFSYALSDE